MNELHIPDQFSVRDEASVGGHTLHGHVTISRRNKKTGEVKFWDEGDNVISISGMQTILMKIFNLFLDSYHSGGQSSTSYIDNRGRDTNLVIPDLNESMNIGTNPSAYTTMPTDISEEHFIQGFMIGNGGAGEDSITTKNTNYSFTNLRRPIPFQQISGSGTLNTSKVGQYCGVLRKNDTTIKSYYIKKFDALPKIYHSWWVDGQRWDYIDPVTDSDLGPNASNGATKTNRIETYAECKLSIDESDCKAYFSASGETATINELGLVAFDTTHGTRSILENLYSRIIVQFLALIFDNNRIASADIMVRRYAETIMDTFDACFSGGACTQTNLSNFYSTVANIYATPETSSIDYQAAQTALSDDNNIKVVAYYDQSGAYQYESDSFMTALQDTSDPSIASLTTDEAQRIKLITYYTFNSIPLEENWEILIDYRLYAN